MASSESTSSAEPAISGGFSDVDGSPFAANLVAYLERVMLHPFVQEVHRASHRMLNLQPGMQVLEVGCGLGADAQEMSRQVSPGGSVLGVDYSTLMVSEAQRRSAESGLPVRFEHGDVCALSMPDASFDAVRAERVFQHLSTPEVAAGEIARVLKPGGRALVIDPDWLGMFVDHPDSALRDRVQARLEHMRKNENGIQAVGRQLHDEGLRDISVEAVTYVETSLERARELLPGLDERIPPQTGLIDDEVRDEWFASLRELDANGTFLVGMPWYLVRATKP